MDHVDEHADDAGGDGDAGTALVGLPPSARPLIVTADEALLDALLRLTAAAGVTPDVAPDVSASRRCWSAASVVLVTDDVAAATAATTPPRRSGVFMVTAVPDDLAVWRQAVALGAERVLRLPDDEGTLIARLADTVEQGRHSTFTVAVVGGCGGAGASTLAAALAVTAGALGEHVLLLDGDPLGGGLDLVLGSETVPGVRWPDLMGTSGRVSAPSLREALPRVGTLSVLSWDRGDLASIPAPVMREVLDAGRRGHGVVVVDLPRRLDAAGEEALLQADTTYLVVPAEVRAVAAATRVAAQLTAVTTRVEVVVRGPGPTGLDGPLVSDSLELPLAAQMRPERGLSTALDLGDGLWRRRRGPLAR
ncbi:MAG: septum site-determining protein, partial [Actinomycetota bacterium]|nr:septum site-determining protein [Actinomycetota bacterium]